MHIELDEIKNLSNQSINSDPNLHLECDQRKQKRMVGRGWVSGDYKAAATEAQDGMKFCEGPRELINSLSFSSGLSAQGP